jgi:CTP synthase
MKTKPTQHSVKELRSIGIQPNIILCRCDRPVPEEEKKKIALFCNVRESSVIEARDLQTIYEAPIAYHLAGLDTELLRHFGVTVAPQPDLTKWETIVKRLKAPDGEVSIAVVGKYTELKDAYKSLIEALQHGGVANNVKVNLRWVESEKFEEKGDGWVEDLHGVHGVLVPGGFGERGTEGKIAAVTFAREHGVPFFGICFGMQMACIEAARNQAGLKGASSSEFGPSKYPIVGLMTEWLKGNELEKRMAEGDMGGTMRLGAYQATLDPGSKVAAIYGDTEISERHRHRYEVNTKYRDKLEAAGLRFSGMSPDGVLPEIVEREDHPWFIGVQYHPELKSRPFEPHPLFASFIGAAVEQSRLV